MILEIVLATVLAQTEVDPLRQAVLCAEVGFSRSVENRDLEAFKSYLDPEVRFVTGGVSKGPDEVAQGWSGFFQADGPKMRWRPAIVEVVANDTLALSRGPYRVSKTDEYGETTHAWGTFNST